MEPNAKNWSLTLGNERKNWINQYITPLKRYVTLEKLNVSKDVLRLIVSFIIPHDSYLLSFITNQMLHVLYVVAFTFAVCFCFCAFFFILKDKIRCS